MLRVDGGLFLRYKNRNDQLRHILSDFLALYLQLHFYLDDLSLIHIYLEQIMFWLFLLGNALYYIVGIALAFAFKDNRAFCKYICPITVFLKPMSYYALTRVTVDAEACVSCGRCKKVCPMNVDMTDNSRKRKNGTECILSLIHI